MSLIGHWGSISILIFIHCFILEIFLMSSSSLIFVSAMSNLLLIPFNEFFISDPTCFVFRNSMWLFTYLLSLFYSWFSLNSIIYFHHLSYFWVWFYWLLVMDLTSHIFLPFFQCLNFTLLSAGFFFFFFWVLYFVLAESHSVCMWL